MRVIPTPLLTGQSGSGLFLVVVLWLPDYEQPAEVYTQRCTPNTKHATRNQKLAPRDLALPRPPLTVTPPSPPLTGVMGG